MDHRTQTVLPGIGIDTEAVDQGAGDVEVLVAFEQTLDRR